MAGSTSGAGCGLPARVGAKQAPGSGFNGGVLQSELVVPDFTLQRATGTPFSTEQLQGRLALVFFGYTHCPDVCPLSLAYVTKARQQLGKDGSQVDAYYVTVDPERDTPARMVDYLSNFDPPIAGLTGSAAELQRAREIFGVVAEKRPLPGSAAEYSMDHTALIYLVDGRGAAPRVRLVYPHGMQPADIAADVRRLLAER